MKQESTDEVTLGQGEYVGVSDVRVAQSAAQESAAQRARLAGYGQGQLREEAVAEPRRAKREQWQSRDVPREEQWEPRRAVAEPPTVTRQCRTVPVLRVAEPPWSAGYGQGSAGSAQSHDVPREEQWQSRDVPSEEQWQEPRRANSGHKSHGMPSKKAKQEPKDEEDPDPVADIKEYNAVRKEYNAMKQDAQNRARMIFMMNLESRELARFRSPDDEAF